ncbi:MAG TPA: amidohydrolase [Candidatus Polarisedimenticolaceae bacterium]|nr:amidohydrolase [Candidatus Polarisedimenticolaceae bacterium]
MQLARRLASTTVLVLLASCTGPGVSRRDGASTQIATHDAADLLFRGGTIYTADPARPRAEAVAVLGGRIVFVGDNGEARRWIGPSTRVVSLAGRMLLPGFHDAHVHPVEAGVQLSWCDLAQCATPEAAFETLRRCAHDHPIPAGADPKKNWFRGRGWQLPVFPEGPRRQDLDAIVGDRPALIASSDGHSAWVNTAALAIAGVTRDTPDPQDGRIERDPKTGEPTGTLRESAAGLVEEHLPPTPLAEVAEGFRRALHEMASHGITSFTEADASEGILGIYQKLSDAGELTAKVSVALETDPEAGPGQVAKLEALRARTRGPRLTASSAKIFADGVIESRTAALLEPYLGDPTGARGLPRYTPDALNDLVEALDRAHFQVHVHAIGDRAVRMTLDAFERAQAKNGVRDARHQIAHLELIDPADIPRFAKLGVVANFQALWAFADPYITNLTLPILGPERSRWIYPIGSVTRSGAAVVFGSDWAVTTVDPLPAIQVGVTRSDPDAATVSSFIPEERVSLESMLEGYTRRGAWIDFREKETGTIEAGKAADLVVLEHDLFAIPPNEIGRTRVLLTLLDGQEIYRAPELAPGS